MDIISIVNTMQPGTIQRFALDQSHIPNGDTSIPFMGGFAVLFPGARLPAEADVSAYAPTYATNVAAGQAASQIAAAASDPITQIANLTAALIASGAITADALPPAQITAVNTKLSSLGVATIAINASPALSVKVVS